MLEAGRQRRPWRPLDVIPRRSVGIRRNGLPLGLGEDRHWHLVHASRRSECRLGAGRDARPLRRSGRSSPRAVQKCSPRCGTRSARALWKQLERPTRRADTAGQPPVRGAVGGQLPLPMNREANRGLSGHQTPYSADLVALSPTPPTPILLLYHPLQTCSIPCPVVR